MSQIKKILFISLISVLISSEIMDNCTEYISDLFPESTHKHHLYDIDKKLKKNIENIVKQKFFRDELHIWNITTTDSSRYYAVLDNVIGKSMPITFLAIFNSNSEIEDITIIKYREPYRGDIRSKSWVNQFFAYTDTSNYIVGDRIDAISGATISVHSATKGIHKLTHLMRIIIKDLNG